MKETARAPSNIAFIKYWGRKDEILRLPTNGSISMNLSEMQTTTTVEFDSNFEKDTIIINGKKQPEENRVVKHLNLIRNLAGITDKVKVITVNNFPQSTGLSSSASGFAALTVAAAKAANLELSERELSILARQGSGSACRSIPDGFVQWLDGDTSETSHAVSLYPPDYWHIADVVVIVNQQEKQISTTEGQKLVGSSPFFPARLTHIENKITELKAYIKNKDFERFGKLVEAEALEMHAIMLTSTPSLIYWLPETLRIMRAVKNWRREGEHVYFTINTGQNIHLLCQQPEVERIVQKIQEIPDIQKIIVNYPSRGAHIQDEHLF